MDSGSGGSDKPRRRRLSRLSQNYSLHSQHPHRSVVDTSPLSTVLANSVDLDSVTFLSSPHKVYQVISGFDERKRSIVESIGFGGLLSLPDITYENKSFYFWLLNRVKWYHGHLTVGNGHSLSMTPEHIGNISGLNFYGIDISDDSLETVNEKLAFIKSKLAFLDYGNGTVEAAETFVQQELPRVLSNEHSDNFKIAFVIFVMGRFLAPSPDHPDGHTNFWGALQNPDEIPLYNWSAYVLSNLLDAARLVNWVIPCQRSLNTVAGCSLILQV